MKIINDYKEFCLKVDILRFDDFDQLGIDPTSRLGLFTKKRLPELKEFCSHNPSYHIISMVEGSFFFINRAINNCKFYFLGAGNNDPDLAYRPRDDF